MELSVAFQGYYHILRNWQLQNPAADFCYLKEQGNELVAVAYNILSIVKDPMIP